MTAVENRSMIFAIGPAGVGKAQPLDAIIYTPTGPKLMGEIKAGQPVLTPDGKNAEVIGVYPQGIKDIYRLTFQDGSQTEACLDHLWKAQLNGRVPKVVSTLGLITQMNSDRKRVKIQSTLPVEFEQRDIDIDPYILGVLLGDGCLSSKTTVAFSSADQDLVDQVRTRLETGYKVNSRSRYDYGIVANHVLKGDRGGYFTKSVGTPVSYYTKALAKDNLSGTKSVTKFIPERYLFNTIKIRTELLQGLLDTDGTCCKKRGSVTYYTISRGLAEDVERLVESLGGICRTSLKNPKYIYNNEIKNGKLCYVLSINLPESIVPFKLKRKLERYKPNSKYKPARYLKSVELIGQKPAQCIKIDHPDHLYLTDRFIVTHNTHCAVGIAVSQYKQKAFSKIVICRPAIEAGEALGYLPGTAEEKLKPYLTPIFDAIEDIHSEKGSPNAGTTISKGPDVEILAFAHMRGRSLKNSIIIVDEAQNATFDQLKMVMTRLGEGSKMILTGDPDQSDLKKEASGLPIVLKLLENNEEIPIVYFDGIQDNLRHPLVGLLIKVFAEYHATQKLTPNLKGIK